MFFSKIGRMVLCSLGSNTARVLHSTLQCLNFWWGKGSLMAFLLPDYVCQLQTYTIWLRNFLIIPNLNLPSSGLKPFLLVLSYLPMWKVGLSPVNKLPFKYWKATLRSPQSLFFMLNKPSFPQSVPVWEVLQPSDYLCSLLLNLVQQLHIFLVLRALTSMQYSIVMRAE